MAKQNNTILPFVPLPNNAPVGQSQILPTEGAVIYGQPQSVANLPANLNYISQQRQARDLAKQAEEEKIAQQWRDNEFAAFDGSIWGDQIAEVEGGLMRRGQDMMQKGYNPWESQNPDAVKFRSDYRNALAMRNYAKNVGTQYLDTLKNIRKDGEQSYDPESIREINDFIQNSKITDNYRANTQLPSIRKRFDINEVTKGLKAVTNQTKETRDGYDYATTEVDRGKTESAILSQILNSSGGANYINNLTGGLPISEIRNAPNSYEETVEYFKNQYRGNPDLQVAFAQNPQMPVSGENDPNFEPAIEQLASKLYSAKRSYDNFMNGEIDRLSSGLKLENSKTRNTKEEQLRLAQSRNWIAQQNLKLQQSKGLSSDDFETREVNIPLSGWNQKDGGNQPDVYSPDYLPLDNSSLNYTGGGVIPLTSRDRPFRQPTSIDGSLVGFGTFPVSNGRVVRSDDNKSDGVERKRFAHIRVGSGDNQEDYLVPVDRIPVQNLNDKNKPLFNSWMYRSQQSQQAQQNTNNQQFIGVPNGGF